MPQDLTATIVDKSNRGIGLTDLSAAATALTEVDVEWRNDGNIGAHIFNGSAGVLTATLKSQKNSSGRGGVGDEDNDEVITIAAGEFGYFPFHTQDGFNASGKTALVCSVFALVKVLLVRQGKR